MSTCGIAQFEVTLEMSICAHAGPRRRLIRALLATSGRRFLATEDWEDSAAGPSQRAYFAESSA